jgi:hypothetical protein
MDGLTYKQDIRNTEPDQDQHRKRQFRDGWQTAAQGQSYGSDVLAQLT